MINRRMWRGEPACTSGPFGTSRGASPGREPSISETAALMADGSATPLAAEDAVGSRRIVLVAGEASGDLHGADLVRALRRIVPNIEIVGLGGERLRQAGMRTVADVADVATVGVIEAVGRLGTLARTYFTLARMVRRDRPDLVILIDFPEFNLRLARVANRAGIPVFYYIGPQVWAWRRGRVRTVARTVDALALVFPFEPPLYESKCQEAEFVGHPLLDSVGATRSREDTLRQYGLNTERVTVALLPGSRGKEIRYVLPHMLAAAEILARERGCQFALALAETVERSEVEAQIVRSGVHVRLIERDTYNLIHAADLVLVASGTATLETALLERPMVIVYRLSMVSYALARMLVGVKFIGIPNIVRGCEVVPELIQGLATGTRIAAAARSILDDSETRHRMVRELAEVRSALGSGGAAARAAEMARRLLGAT
jgi:lipid-A-disaccharide synthase